MNIIVHPTSTSTITTSACNQLAFGPIIYTTPGTYTHTFTSVFGCDSTVTINLVSIFHVNDSVTQNGNLLTAHQSFAGYQWVNCSNGYALIAGATNQSYTATANGSYAVIIYKNGCIDTSNCYTVTNIGIDEYTNSNGITITPNPFTSQTTITFSEAQKNTTIKITDVLGNVIQQLTTNNRQLTLDMSGFAKGIYFVRITDENKNVVNRKIVLN